MATATQRRGKTTMAKKPCETLKALRERAGLSGQEMARAMGKEAKTTYFRYEDPGRMKDRPIPWRAIERWIPVMVGKGEPPIQVEELVAISDARNFSSVGRVALNPVLTQGPGSLPVNRPSSELAGAGIPLRFWAERGSYTDTALLASKSYGPSIIAASPEWPVDRQFAVRVGDVHAMADFGKGDVLHVVSGENPVNRAVVMSVEKGRDTGIAEILVARFVAVEGDAVTAKLSSGALVSGRVLGVVVGIYRRAI